MESRENTTYDELFMSVLCKEQSIPDFLNIVFGFLYRRTDLFVEQTSPGHKFGYPPGQCDRLVYDSMKHFQLKAKQRNQSGEDMQLFDQVVENEEIVMDEVEVTPTAQSTNNRQASGDQAVESEVKSNSKPDTNIDFKTNSSKIESDLEKLNVNTTRLKGNPESPNRSISSADSSINPCESNVPIQTPTFIKRTVQSVSSNCYNGADRGEYAWAQNITDLDVEVRVSESVLKSRQIDVSVTSDKIKVLVDGSQLLSGEFSHGVKKDETVWTLTPGKYVQIHLEKAKPVWWDQLIKSEPKIDLTHIDSTRPFSELAQEEQMKVNELLWNDYRKSQGLPTSEQMKTANILKEAWNAEGSPFKGREFDPSIINN